MRLNGADKGRHRGMFLKSHHFLVLVLALTTTVLLSCESVNRTEANVFEITYLHLKHHSVGLGILNQHDSLELLCSKISRAASLCSGGYFAGPIKCKSVREECEENSNRQISYGVNAELVFRYLDLDEADFKTTMEHDDPFRFKEYIEQLIGSESGRKILSRLPDFSDGDAAAIDSIYKAHPECRQKSDKPICRAIPCVILRGQKQRIDCANSQTLDKNSDAPRSRAIP